MDVFVAWGVVFLIAVLAELVGEIGSGKDKTRGEDDDDGQKDD